MESNFLHIINKNFGAGEDFEVPQQSKNKLVQKRNSLEKNKNDDQSLFEMKNEKKNILNKKKRKSRSKKVDETDNAKKDVKPIKVIKEKKNSKIPNSTYSTNPTKPTRRTRDNKITKEKQPSSLSPINTNNNEETTNYDQPKTLLEIINDTKSGLPMASELNNKRSKPRKKQDSDNSETFSVNQSEISGRRSDKPFLRNKAHRDQKESKIDNSSNSGNRGMGNSTNSVNSQTLGNQEVPGSNYGKFFKPKLIWDPVQNKMIIEKPTIQEASLKMQEEIMKNTNPIFDEKGDIVKITSASFKKSLHTDKWSEDETTFFFRALECFGTDFSFLEIVLKPRNRAQIKNKFRKEEKDNPILIESALKKYDPKKLVKIMGVLKQFKEEMKARNKRKFYPGRKNKDNEKMNNFDFRKLFMEVDLDKEDLAYNSDDEVKIENERKCNKEKMNKEVEDYLENLSFPSEDEDDSSEKSVRKSVDDRTVSILNHNEESEEEGNEYSYLRGSQKSSLIPNAGFNSNIRKTSKVKVIINEQNGNSNNIVEPKKEVKEEVQGGGVFCYDFLKKFQ